MRARGPRWSAARETTAWVVPVEGWLYLRTNDSRWLENIRRNPDLTLRVRGSEQAFRARIETRQSVHDSVETTFKE